MRRRALFPTIAFASAVLASTVHCYAPTQVELEVLTDVHCQARPSTWLYQNGTVPIAETEDCEERTDLGIRSMGTLVLVPSGDRDARVVINATLTVGGKKPEACTPADPADCAFASRSFTYQPQTRLRLPLRIYQECLGKPPCPDGTTCGAGGACENNAVVCEGADCERPGDPPVIPPPRDAGADGPLLSGCKGSDNENDNVLETLSSMPTHFAGTFDTLYWTDETGQLIARRKEPTAKAEPKLQYQGVTAIAASRLDAWVGHHGNGIIPGIFLSGVQGTVQEIQPSPAFGLPVAIAIAQGTPAVRPVYYAGSEQGIEVYPSASVPFRPDLKATQLAVAGDYVYAALMDRFVAIHRTQPAVVTDVTGVLKPAILVSDGTNAFVADNGVGAILRLVGTSATPFVTNVRPGALGLDAGFLYWPALDNAQRTQIRRKAIVAQGTASGSAVGSADERLDVRFIVPDPLLDGCVYFVAAQNDETGSEQPKVYVMNKPSGPLPGATINP